MILCSGFMAVFGAMCFFSADLVTELFDQSASATLFISLYGAVLFGFAYANWMVRNVPLGGIYGRAIITGNLIHLISGLGLLLDKSVHFHCI